MGEEDSHHYTAGIFDNEYDAKACGIAEYFWRGTKYEPKIYKHNLNEWRNGSRNAMFQEIKNSSCGNKDIKELYKTIGDKK